MGSLIGGAYATGRLNELKEWICALDKGKVFRLVDFTLSKQGLIKADRVLNKMKDYVPDVPIEDLPLPYAAVAVDMIKKEEVVFREGSLYHAIRASIAIPSVLTPLKIGNQLLVDGGVLNNIPIEHVQRSQRDIIIAVNVNADLSLPKPKVLDAEGEKRHRIYQGKIREFYSHLWKSSPGSKDEDLGYFSLLTRTLDLMTMHMAELTLRHHPPDILINVSRESCNMYDFYKAEEMIKLGREAAVFALQS